ncbi:hypothetical protein Nepgr_010543 [Nepenthes gracilis]|uniref:peptidylprolyl isomerase n=1 Tax=Nepenthes gracilis TaxID=150966 RepID=A0AAD3SCI3_NEPGR|nr:hypothetical protein Nepgr_010543 [Nepenthes gracilis]
MATLGFLLPLGSALPKRITANYQTIAREKKGVTIIQCQKTRPSFEEPMKEECGLNLVKRRDVIGLLLGLSYLLVDPLGVKAAGLPPEQKPKLCDDACEKELENVPMITTESGLQYRDIMIGEGPSPPVGFQVAANYVAMVPSGQIFDSSLDKGLPYIFLVGVSEHSSSSVDALFKSKVIKGLDEGILSMKVGGKRRLYIPGPLAFPKGLASAPGRPRVAPNSAVVFDVSLEYIPGLGLDEE